MMALLNQVVVLWSQWMAEMTLQVSPLVVCLAILERLLRRFAWPELLQAMWMLVAVRLIVPPAVALPTGMSWMPPARLAVRSEASVEPSALPATLFWIWLAGVVFLLTWRFFRCRRQRRELMMKSKPASSAWLLSLTCRAADRFGVATPAVRIAESLGSPLVTGVFRPVVILPRQFVDGAPRGQIELALFHECAHIRRRDAVWALLCQLLHIVYWPNPLVWVARRRWAELREICCDRAVVDATGDAEAYRRTLAELAWNLSHGANRGGLTFLNRGSQLMRRLDWLDCRTTARSRWHALATAATIVGLALCLLPHTSSGSPPQPEIIKSAPPTIPSPVTIASELAGKTDGAPQETAVGLSDLEGCLQRRYLIWSMIPEDSETVETSHYERGHDL